jgi:hypothetical protein
VRESGSIDDGFNVSMWTECTKGVRRFQANDNKKSVGQGIGVGLMQRIGLGAGLREIILAKRSKGRSGLRVEQRSDCCRTSQAYGYC